MLNKRFIFFTISLIFILSFIAESGFYEEHLCNPYPLDCKVPRWCYKFDSDDACGYFDGTCKVLKSCKDMIESECSKGFDDYGCTSRRINDEELSYNYGCWDKTHLMVVDDIYPYRTLDCGIDKCAGFSIVACPNG